MWNKNSILALSVLVGATVGAGIFAIPYAIAKAGLIPGLFYFVILTIAVLSLHLFFTEVTLRTSSQCRLVGLAKEYLGQTGKLLITLSTIVGVSGACLAYMVLAGGFLKIIFSAFIPSFEISAFYLALGFWLILSTLVFKGVKTIAIVEFIMSVIFLLIIFIILIISAPLAKIENIRLFNTAELFLPYGVILFALSGWLSIPLVEEILEKDNNQKSFKRVVVSSVLITSIIYLVFSLIVVGVCGVNTTDDSLGGLSLFLGQKIVILGALFGVFAIAASFIVLGNYLKHTLKYDYKINNLLSASIACGVPLALFLAGLREFISIVGFIGTFIGVVEGIVIILIFRKAKTKGDRKPEFSLNIPSFLLIFLALIFVLGAISQLFL